MDDVAAGTVKGAPSAARPGLYAYYVLGMLCLANIFASMDRYAFFILIPPIQKEFMASDASIGFVSGLAFVIFYALFGIPVARWVDKGSRRTVLAVSMAVWSMATVLGGMAGSMVQLGLARAALGAGEAGATPASNSLIADYFNKTARPLAVAMFQAGMGLSAILAVPLLGVVATQYGWRAAMFAMGAPGVLLALIIYLTVREPVRGGMDAVKTVAARGGRSLGAALKAMIANRAFLYLVASQVMVGIATGVLPVWFPMYLVRAYGLSLPSVGAVMGLLNGAVMLAAFAAAGALTSWLLRARPGDHWTARIPAIACTVAAPLLLATLNVPSLAACVALGAVFYLMLFASRPGAFTLSIELVSAQDRGLSASIIVIASSVVGAGFGPLIVGLISDALTPSVGEVQALRTAILVTVPPAILLAGLFFFGAARRMKAAAAS